jgi:hypothetical protein
MPSPFYVLRTTQPDDCQIGREVRTTDEVARVQPGGLVYCKGENLVNWVRRQGFAIIIDPTDTFVDLQRRPVNERGMILKEAAKVLGLPVGAVANMARAGKFETFTFPKGDGTVVLREEQVQAVARIRAQEKAAADAVKAKRPKTTSKEEK